MDFNISCLWIFLVFYIVLPLVEGIIHVYLKGNKIAKIATALVFGIAFMILK